MPDNLPVKAHAFLSPSAASRWLACPAAPWMESKYGVDEAKPYAEEGTRAHAEAERCAIAVLSGKSSIDEIVATIGDEELRFCIRMYLEAITNVFFDEPEHWAVECSIDLSGVYGVPNQFGTADCILVAGGVLHVFDYKHGVGVPVSAERNTQLAIYALGVLNSPALSDVHSVVLHIIQPRLPTGPVHSSWAVNRDELNAFRTSVILVAKRVIEIREAGMADSTDYSPGDKTCRFCKARSACGAYAERTSGALGFSKGLPSPKLATNDELGAMLSARSMVKKFFSDLETEAFSRIRLGHEVPGFKIVGGNQGNRRWRDKAEATELLTKTMRIPAAVAYKKELINPTAAEKLYKQGVIGPKQWNKLKNCIVRSAGKPTLADAEDDRPALVFDIAEEIEEIVNGA